MSFGKWGNSPDQYLLIMEEPADDLRVSEYKQ